MRITPLIYLALTTLSTVAAETISFPAPNNLTLSGEWFPAKAPPAPAVILAHGCAGLYGTQNTIHPRDAAMVEYLNERGYSVLMVDSFRPRGMKEICTTPISKRTISPTDRANDLYAGLEWLTKRPDVDGKRVGLLGWSNGGSTTLRTIGQNRPASSARFAAAISFYPGCAGPAESGFTPTAPLLILIGAEDDWTPAAPCQKLVEQYGKKQPPIELVSYPNTWHDFDNPMLKAKRLRSDVPNGVRPGSGVTLAPNPEAARDAWQRTAEWLGRWMPAPHAAAPAPDLHTMPAPIASKAKP
ncbi:dienelactone hydrolase family protein [Parachitinimonas caeni]|uniref:Dienelactone hydrolase family protein n=1 Tax=Parachitinimonas caeni TaxID=3031301 RepID=A0ABT7E2I4_9NEIS|nr:dienelactone hydrolase family protein [Parachitinimonas caeni]MDK2126528.1 dienelactone hydrolase family protein [Parachitinimonas caeni]